MTEGREAGGKPDGCLGRSRKKRQMVSGTMDVEEGGTMDEAKKNRLAVGAIEEFKRRQKCHRREQPT